MDPQAAATFYLRTRPKVKGGSKALVRGKREVDDVIKGTDYANLDLLPADFSYRHMDAHLEDSRKPVKRIVKILRPLRAEYDYVFLDCAPSISTVSETVFRVVDALLVPLIPTTLSLRTFHQITDFLEKKGLKNVPILPFFSLVDRRKRLHNDIVMRLPLEWPGMLLTSIPYASDVEKMGINRSAVGEHAPSSVAAHAYRDLWDEIKTRMDIY